jgi:hypothetical protein
MKLQLVIALLKPFSLVEYKSINGLQWFYITGEVNSRVNTDIFIIDTQVLYMITETEIIIEHMVGQTQSLK